MAQPEKSVNKLISSTAQTSQANSNASSASIVKEADTNKLHTLQYLF